jgi:hypothetical protein
MATEILAVITESVQMQGAPFSSASVSVEGETAQIVETTISAGATITATGIAFPYNKCGLIYLLSDTNDCTVTFTNSGTSITVDLIGGQPYLIYTETVVAAKLLRDVLTMTVENLNTADGVASVVATDFHARLVLTA